jgi:hypothetical protein
MGKLNSGLWSGLDCEKTSLKAFSHQRRAKPFNTLGSEADLFEKTTTIFRQKNLSGQKSHFKFDKSIIGRKAVCAEKPLLPKIHFWPKSLIKFDPFLTDLIQENQKSNSHFYPFCTCDNF